MHRLGRATVWCFDFVLKIFQLLEETGVWVGEPPSGLDMAQCLLGTPIVFAHHVGGTERGGARDAGVAVNEYVRPERLRLDELDCLVEVLVEGEVLRVFGHDPLGDRGHTYKLLYAPQLDGLIHDGEHGSNLISLEKVCVLGGIHVTEVDPSAPIERSDDAVHAI